ncbi:o-succinylbenzoate--CoA ligase [Bacillus spongiae]|uniref:2-succinylbenzoate--CoA ligase n=1 Tax=Bacillus spongiae TaxID=2683610 RepID=A0ABU8HHX5_9BACI
MKVPNWLVQRASQTPDRTAVVGLERNYTFRELLNESLTVGGQLRDKGVRPGDHIGVLMSNSEQMVVLIHSLQQLGCVCVLLNTRLTVNELSFQIQNADIRYICTEESFLTYCPSADVEAILMLQELFNGSEQNSLNPRTEFELTQTCSIMYTSGTTGRPKGVLQTYENHWWSAIGSVLNLGLSDKDCWLCAVPLYHISGYSIVMRSVIYGIAMKIYREFEEEKINEDLEVGKGTIISVVATMASRLLAQLENRSYSPLFRCFLLGGGPAPISLLEQCKTYGIPVYQTYGMTETCSQIVTLPPEYSLSKLGSSGKPLFPCQLMIINSNEHGEGEIAVKGPNVSPGYFKQQEANKKAYHDGWFLTGDIGYLDEEGFLYVIDRRADLIISGGENIYPAEIENILHSHPAVEDAGVIGIDHEKWGEVPFAFVSVRYDVNKQDLLKWCEQHLAKYKLPHDVLILDRLPRNASNKIVRRDLVKKLPRR